MLEKFLAAEVLEVWVLHPAIAQSLVRKVVSVFEVRHCPGPACLPGWPPRLDRLNYSGSMASPFAALCGRTSNLYPTPGTERMNRGAFGSGSILRRKRA